jgi:hypothetical protein
VRAGLLSRELSIEFRALTRFRARKATLLVALGESLVGPARSENLRTYGVFMRENREISWSPPVVDGCPVLDGSWGGISALWGRAGNAEVVIRR